MDTFEQVKRILAEILNLPEEMIIPEAALKDYLHADSLDLVGFTLALEEEFGVQFDDEALELTTVQQIVDYVEAKRKEQAVLQIL